MAPQSRAVRDEADRLLAIKEINAQYRKLLKELAGTVFTADKINEQAEAIAKATSEIRKKGAAALAARREPPAGFGGPGGPGTGGTAPQPPELKTFARKRAASIAAQLAGAGASRATGVGFVGTRTWRVVLRNGTLVVRCDPHRTTMRRTVSVA